VIRHRLLLLVPILLVALVSCAWYGLLHTESGARWIFARAQTASNGALQAERLNGDLKSGLTIRRLTFSTDSMTLEIVETRLVVNLDLLPLQVQISDASIENTTIQVGASGEVSQTKISAPSSKACRYH